MCKIDRRIRALLAAGTILVLPMLATAAPALPAGPAPADGVAGRSLSTAGVTVGRPRALPNKKRLHQERKARS